MDQIRNIAIDPVNTHASHQLIDVVYDDNSNETIFYCSALNRFGASPIVPDTSHFMQAVNKVELTHFDKMNAKFSLANVFTAMNASAKSGYRFNRDEHSLIYTMVFDDDKKRLSFEVDKDTIRMTDKISCEQIAVDQLNDRVLAEKVTLWCDLFKAKDDNIHQVLHSMQHNVMSGLYDWTQEKNVCCIGVAVKRGQTKGNRVPGIYFNTSDIAEGKMPKQMDGYDYYVPGTCSMERSHLINMAVMTGYLNNKQIFSSEFISAVASGLNDGYLKRGNRYPS